MIMNTVYFLCDTCGADFDCNAEGVDWLTIQARHAKWEVTASGDTAICPKCLAKAKDNEVVYINGIAMPEVLDRAIARVRQEYQDGLRDGDLCFDIIIKFIKAYLQGAEEFEKRIRIYNPLLLR